MTRLPPHALVRNKRVALGVQMAELAFAGGVSEMEMTLAEEGLDHRTVYTRRGEEQRSFRVDWPTVHDLLRRKAVSRICRLKANGKPWQEIRIDGFKTSEIRDMWMDL